MTVAATGFFDGVHLGHRKVVAQVCAVAAEKGANSQIVTFWPHPRGVLQQDACNLRLLTTQEEKNELFRSIGIDSVCTLEFTKEFSMLSTREFVKLYLKEKCGVDTLVIGYDHKIGHDGSSQEQMMQTCREAGLEVIRVEEFTLDGMVISSTKIRGRLEAGDVETANKWLGYRYGFKGVVVSGNRIGRTIGFPTANLKLYAPLKMVPGDGVYCVLVEVNRKVYAGICNIGVRPTVDSGTERTIETHILDFDEDIYGLDMKIEFLERIRDEIRFASLEDLKKQLALDRHLAREKYCGEFLLNARLR